MKYDIFLLPLLLSFAISASILILLILIGRKKMHADDRKSSRHMHQKGVLRFGGMALIISFAITIALNDRLTISAPLVGVLFGSVAILILGIIDDVIQLSWKTQLFFQLAIVMAVYIMGIQLQYMSNPFGGIILFNSGIGHIIGIAISIAWVLFIMNAMNWVDGVDGVSGGITLIGMVAIFFLILRPEVNQPTIGIMAAAASGALIAFVFLNFYPAKIMAGTSGSMFMGFMLATMAIFAGAKIATTLLVLAIPIIDALWVVRQRLKAGDSIFSADKKHLHFKLRQIGWSPKKICIFYYIVTIFIAIIALNAGAVGKAISFTLFVLVMVIAFYIINSKAVNIEK